MAKRNTRYDFKRKNNKVTKPKDRFFDFIVAVAIFTWFFFVFPPMLILMHNKNTKALYTTWATILLVLITFLIILYFAYKGKKK